MKITDYKEWDMVVERLKSINNTLGIQLLNIDATPENIGKIGELQGGMKMIHTFLGLPDIIWPPDEIKEGDDE